VRHSAPQPSPSPVPSPPPPPPSLLWPLPAAVSFGAARLAVSPSLVFSISGGGNADLAAYAARTAALMFQHAAAAPSGAALSTVSIAVANPTAPLALGVDESYELTIPADGSAATITAATNYGAFWALQTLTQLVAFDFEGGGYAVAGVPVVVTDGPKFPWRGLMVDTSRHWLTLPALYTIIDALTYAKLNTLHWHIVDWQAWPLQSKALPALWAASWSPRERYTLRDVAAVLEYGRARGVRVVLEFDTPGHASSMCVSYPAMCCGAVGGATPLTPVPDATGKNVSLDAIRAVLSELAALPSAGEFLHLGGDEVDQSCWNSTPSVRAWMKEHGIDTTDGVYEYFISAVDAAVLALNVSPIRWEEVWAHFGTGLDKRTVVHAWLSRAALVNATSHGYRAIYSVNSDYYLSGPHINMQWPVFYDADPLEGVAVASAPLVLGGETALWAETVDGSDAVATIFPRAAAAAERQWSYDHVTNSKAPFVEARLAAFRCHLLERGVGAAPLDNAVAHDAPHGPGSCTRQ